MARSIFGLDIGTSNIKIYCSDRDEILNEKNIIAIAHKKDVFAVGDEAYEMHEKAPGSIRVTFPVKYGDCRFCQYAVACHRVHKEDEQGRQDNAGRLLYCHTY